MKYCIHCGQRIEDDAVFCDYCGSPQTQTEPRQAPPAAADPYQRTQPTQNNPPPAAAAPKKQKSRKKGTAVVGGAMAVIITAGVFFLKSLFPIGDGVSDPPGTTPPPAPKPPQQQEQSLTPQQPEESQQPVESQQPAEPQQPAESQQNGQDGYVVVDHPSFSDFDWYTQTVQTGAMPGEDFFTAYGDIAGPWKCMIVFYENGTSSAPSCRELLDADFSGDVYNAVLTMKPYQIEWGNSLEDEQSQPAITYNGGLDEASEEIAVSSEYGDIYLTANFCRSGDHQYGMGYMVTAGGVYADVMFVRP